MTETITLRCIDDPEANGRTPQRGDARYTLTFPLESGDSLNVLIGRPSLNYFATFIAQMMVDDSNSE